jgi:hypothetical protein
MNGIKKKKPVSIIQTGSALIDAVKRQVEERPYVVIAVAGGAAFGFGALMGSRVGRLLTMLCASYAMKELARGEVGQRVANAVRKGLDDLTTADAKLS